MTWLNAWAWWGLAALAVPVAIHLLTRAQPRPQPFPTLRFLTQATSTAVRRRTIMDRALLAVRLGVLAAVVAALAGPTLPHAVTGANAPIARAVVIDSSIAADAARDRVAQLEPAASESTSITADRLTPAIARAAAWLRARGGRGELVVVSAFRRGDLDRADLESVGSDAGIRLLKVDAPAATTASLGARRVADRLWTARPALDADRTSVVWTSSPASTTSPSFLSVVGDRGQIAAALNAASVIGLPIAGEHPITIVLPDAPDRASSIAGLRPVDESWMFDVIDALRRDPVIDAASRRISSLSATSPVQSAAPVVRDVNGVPLVEAASGAASSGRELRLLVGTTDPLFLSAIVASAARSETDPTALRRLEPVTLTTDELSRWERPLPTTGVRPQSPENGDWLGRWFWIAALALLALETWMRRTTTGSTPAEITHARVA